MDAAALVERCGVHPDRAAGATCVRCGTFVCSDCARRGSPGGPLCASCDALVGVTPVEWESRERGATRGYVVTLLAILRTPTAFFTRLPDGSLSDAAVFMAVTFAPAILFTGAIASKRDQLLTYFCSIACAVVFAPLGPIVYATVVHGVARVAGAQGTQEGTVRACLYAATPLVLSRYVELLISAFPLPGQAVRAVDYALVAAASLLAVRSIALYLRGRRGLPARIAWIPPVVPALLVVVAVFGIGTVAELLRAHGVPATAR